MNKTLTALCGAALMAFASVAEAQEQRCAPLNILEYDLQKTGQSFQSGGDVASEFEDHRMEIYANSDTGQWTMVETKAGEDACFYSLGGIFFHEGPQEGDGFKALRQSALARHGYGDGNNEAFELFVHEGTDRWVLTRRISEDKSEIVMAGRNYKEENNSPVQPIQRVNFEGWILFFRHKPRKKALFN